MQADVAPADGAAAPAAEASKDRDLLGRSTPLWTQRKPQLRMPPKDGHPMQAVVVGLKARAELNGCVAETVGPLVDGRYPCRVLTMAEPDCPAVYVKIKPEHLSQPDADKRRARLVPPQSMNFARWMRVSMANGTAEPGAEPHAWPEQDGLIAASRLLSRAHTLHASLERLGLLAPSPRGASPSALHIHLVGADYREGS
jgi:hypothetical protein